MLNGRQNDRVTSSPAERPTPAATKQRLMDAAFEVVRDQGWAGSSARVIAAHAGVNQALIFYHFGTVDDLVAAASDDAVARAVAAQRTSLAEATTLTDLVSAGRVLSDRNQSDGNAAFMAQVMAAGQHNPTMAAAASRAISLWEKEITDALHRVLAGGLIAEVLPIADLAPLISGGFIGLELQSGVDPDGAHRAMRAMEALAELTSALGELGPAQSRIARSAINRMRRTSDRASARAFSAGPGPTTPTQ